MNATVPANTIPANTKCVITSVPDAGGIFGNLLNSNATAADLMGARGTGAQQFKLDAGGTIFGNADTGFTVVPK